MTETVSEDFKVEPIYNDNHGYALNRPYIVRINGKTLMDKGLNPRRFKDSMKAAVAGAKEVDRLKAERANT